jgi:hypothetical protein
MFGKEKKMKCSEVKEEWIDWRWMESNTQIDDWYVRVTKLGVARIPPKCFIEVMCPDTFHQLICRNRVPVRQSFFAASEGCTLSPLIVDVLQLREGHNKYRKDGKYEYEEMTLEEANK